MGNHSDGHFQKLPVACSQRMAIWCEGNTSKTIQFFQGNFLSCIQNHREILYNFCHQRDTIVKFSKFTVINTIVILSIIPAINVTPS